MQNCLPKSSFFCVKRTISGISFYSQLIYIKLMSLTRQFYTVFLSAMLFFLLLWFKNLTLKIHIQ